ncbi:MAG: NAD(+)/NADH kinase [Desulfofustis sp. PB-SRB1]|nr:NAD(+)/NADH kinase [Desulfofustis sp. PB-SRB1]
MEHRSLLSTRLKSGSSWSSPRYALNDVVISKNAVDRLFYLATGADGHHITPYRADGLVFSTPTGSTAYNLSAGGPLVHPDLGCPSWVTPICPFMLSSRPIMLPPTATITSHYLAHEGDATAMVIVDGQQGWEMNPGDTLEVKMAGRPPHPDHFNQTRLLQHHPQQTQLGQRTGGIVFRDLWLLWSEALKHENVHSRSRREENVIPGI